MKKILKIGLFTTNTEITNHRGFYNSQDVGLAKELGKLFGDVVIFRPTQHTDEYGNEIVEGFPNIIVKYLLTRRIGSNGFVSLKKLDKNLDILICFSDTQLDVPRVYKWCDKNGIRFIPYIGSAESRSNNKLKRIIINILFRRNICVYEKCTCLVKTPAVKMALQARGIKDCRLAPVGLDLGLVNADYRRVDSLLLKAKWGFDKSDKILLFIARMSPEKRPLHMINIFEKVQEKDSSYKLVMVGTGILYNDVIDRVRKDKITDSVTIIERMANYDIWELYRIAYAFVNLNLHEIFGMAILEAMYYECKVVAREAPGPNFIIENGISGVLCKTDFEIVEGIMNKDVDGCIAHQSIIDSFTWASTVGIIEKLWKDR